MIDEKKIKKLLKNSNTCIMATDNGCAVIGNKIAVLTSLSMLLIQLNQDISKEELQRAFETAFKEPSEMLEDLLKMAKDLEKKLKKIKAAEKESE